MSVKKHAKIHTFIFLFFNLLKKIYVLIKTLDRFIKLIFKVPFQAKKTAIKYFNVKVVFEYIFLNCLFSNF